MRIRRLLLEDCQGSALVAVLLVAMLLLTGVVSYQGWSSQVAQGGVHRLSTGKALSYAEGGMASAMDSLRNPQSATTLLPGASTTMSFPYSNGHADVVLNRDSNDTGLVTLVTTGYYQLQGSTITAVINAVVRTRCIGDFFAVVPTTLQIAFGTDLSQASVYARDLVFQTAGSGVAGPTKIGQAFYSNSVQPAGAIDPSLVEFEQAPLAPQKLSAEPSFVGLGVNYRATYASWAGNDQLVAGQDVSGTLGLPVNTYGVYFCPGDLVLGESSPLTVTGNVVIYSAGTVTIQNNVQAANASSWLAVIAENGIVLGASAPAAMTLQGTFITGGSFSAIPPATPRAGGLFFTGGFHAQGGAAFAQGWPQRVYTFQRPPASMLLPFFINVEQYNVVQGKFNQ